MPELDTEGDKKGISDKGGDVEVGLHEEIRGEKQSHVARSYRILRHQ